MKIRPFIASTLPHSIDRLSRLLALAAGLIVVALIVLTFCDVVLRYNFSAPMKGRQDIVEMGMVLSLMLAAPFTWRTGGHISVDLYNRLPLQPLDTLRIVVIKMLAAALFALLAWKAWHASADAELFNEATNMISIPHQPFILVIAALSLFHCLLLVIEIITDIFHYSNHPTG